MSDKPKTPSAPPPPPEPSITRMQRSEIHRARNELGKRQRVARNAIARAERARLELIALVGGDAVLWGCALCTYSSGADSFADADTARAAHMKEAHA